ncbi:MAG: helix-turn-helix domain-containing protein [Pseudobdellovibrionaceae bacterium]
MKKVGEILKEKREGMKLGLHEVAAVLKINQKTLAAIESGETDPLLNRTFIRGFIRSYATFLKLDSKEMLQLYLLQSGEGTKLVYSADDSSQNNNGESIEAPDEKPIDINTKPNVEKAIPFQAENQSQSYFLVGILGLVVVLSVAFAIKATMKRYKNETIVIPQTNITQDSDPVNLPESAKPVTPEELKALSLPATTPDPIISLETSTTENKKPMSEKPISQEATVPVTEVKPVVEAKPIVTTKPEVAKTDLESNPVVEATPAASGTKEVIVESQGDVSISYSIQNKVNTIQLKKDQVHTFKVQGPIQLQISDGQMINVNVNGRDIGKPSTQAGPVSVTY